MIDSKERAKKKLISNARTIIANQVGMPVGILTMDRLITTYSKEVNEFGLLLSSFKSAFEEIRDLALGSERLNFNIDTLIKQDQNLNSTLSKYHDSILTECFNLIKTLESRD